MITLSESPETVRALTPPILRFKTEAEIKAEKILDGWEDDRNRDLLREMNGRYCSSAQATLLHDNNFFAVTDETAEEFDARMAVLGLEHSHLASQDRSLHRAQRRGQGWDDFRYGWTAAGMGQARGNAGKGGNT